MSEAFFPLIIIYKVAVAIYPLFFTGWVGRRFALLSQSAHLISFIFMLPGEQTHSSPLSCWHRQPPHQPRKERHLPPPPQLQVNTKPCVVSYLTAHLTITVMWGPCKFVIALILFGQKIFLQLLLLT